MTTRTLSVAALIFSLGIGRGISGDFSVTSFDRPGNVTWTNAFGNGICTIESASVATNGMANQWRVERSFYTSNSVGQATLPVNATNRFFRLLAVDISTNTPQGYTNLLQSYGKLQTIAGTGAGGTDGVNYWKPSFEGGYATNAALSRPHNALADDAGNIYIVDKDSHSVLKVTTDGRIHTVAGTHAGGFNGDGPALGTTLKLFQPNGIYLRGDNVLFILDTGNGKVRRLDTNGIMSTLFTVPGGIVKGRGLWVDDATPWAVFCDGIYLKAWDATNGVTILNTNFTELGNIIATDKKNIIATDRGDGTVWKVDAHDKNVGDRTFKYGGGGKRPFVDGTSALTNSLYGVRGVWKLPTDGYLLALHEGAQIIYVDSADIGHILVDGLNGYHSGDGQWFHTPGYKMAQARSVSMDNQGNILIVENDYGYVRRIELRRMTP